MSATPSPAAAALARLERSLLRRRFGQLDLRLRLELLALSLLAAGFVGWQVRIPLDGVARRAGAFAAAGRLGAAAALVLLFGAILAAARHRRALREHVGPPWLALPVPVELVARHLERVSSWWALWALVPAAGLLAAGVGLLPPWLHAAIAAATLALLLPAGRAGAAFAAAGFSALRIADRRRGFAARLEAAHAGSRRARVGGARWARRPAWLALWLKDLALSLRPGPVRSRLAVALLVSLASALAWRLRQDPRLVAFLAFAGALLAAAMIAEWIVELCGSDPFPVLRALPLGVGSVWGARCASALLAAGVLVGLHAALLASTLTPILWPPAVWLQLASTGVATLLIATLGANYGVTLFPRADHALRVLGITLGIAIAASLMIPLLGWVTLVTGWIHSARRLPRWRTLEAL